LRYAVDAATAWTKTPSKRQGSGDSAPPQKTDNQLI
jgi:hypothetical protein